MGTSVPFANVLQPMHRHKGSLPRSVRSRNFPSEAGSPGGRPPIGLKSPARYGNIGKTNGNVHMIAELRKFQSGIRRSASAPANIDDDAETASISDFRTSGFSVATQGTAATSVMSRQHSKDGSQSGGSMSELKGRPKAKALDSDTSPSPLGLPTLSEDMVLGEESEPTSPPAPAPPPAPPMPDYLRGENLGGQSGQSPPAPPPPPPPPGIVFSGASDLAPPPPPMPAFLAGIAAGVQLRRTGSSSKRDLMPPPPIMRRSSKRYSKAYAVPDRRKDVAFKASKKMKTLQWEKVQQGKLDNTLWARADEEQAQEEVAEKLKMVDVWSEMEDEFKAREAALDAVCECLDMSLDAADPPAAKRKKEELKSVLEPSVRKRVGKCVVHSLCTR